MRRDPTSTRQCCLQRYGIRARRAAFGFVTENAARAIFGGWNPLGVLLGAFLFGLVEALSFHAQALNLPISSYALQAMPYIFTVLVLALGAHYRRRRRLGAPSALGLSWQRS